MSQISIEIIHTLSAAFYAFKEKIKSVSCSFLISFLPGQKCSKIHVRNDIYRNSKIFREIIQGLPASTGRKMEKEVRGQDGEGKMERRRGEGEERKIMDWERWGRGREETLEERKGRG